MNNSQTNKNVLILATENAHKVEEIKAILGASSFMKGRVIKALSDYPQKPVLQETGTTLLENARLKAEQAAAFFETSGLEPALWGVLSDDSGLCVDALGGAPGVYSARYAEGLPGDISREERDRANRRKLLTELAAKTNMANMADIANMTERRAAFLTTLVLLQRNATRTEGHEPLKSSEIAQEQGDTVTLEQKISRIREKEPLVYSVTGKALGWIGLEERGSEGFGYDSIFIPDQAALTDTDSHTHDKNDTSRESLQDKEAQLGRSFAQMSATEKNSFSHRRNALKLLIEAITGTEG